MIYAWFNYAHFFDQKIACALMNIFKINRSPYARTCNTYQLSTSSDLRVSVKWNFHFFLNSGHRMNSRIPKTINKMHFLRIKPISPFDIRFITIQWIFTIYIHRQTVKRAAAKAKATATALDDDNHPSGKIENKQMHQIFI